MFFPQTIVPAISLEERDIAPWLERSLRCDGSSDRSFMVDPLSFLSIEPVVYDWCNKGRGMCYPVCGMVHINEQDSTYHKYIK